MWWQICDSGGQAEPVKEQKQRYGLTQAWFRLSCVSVVDKLLLEPLEKVEKEFAILSIL